jgi:hypothetical protein
MTVSAPMQARLDKIEAHLNEHNLSVEKRYGFFPVLKSNSNESFKPLATGGASGSGFSWIAFFWPFAVLTQIREFSFFGYVAIINIITAWINVLTGTDVTTAAGISIGVVYAYWFPYLRYLALKEEKEEMSVITSIILGLLLVFAAAIPAALIETVFTSA